MTLYFFKADDKNPCLNGSFLKVQILAWPRISGKNSTLYQQHRSSLLDSFIFEKCFLFLFFYIILFCINFSIYIYIKGWMEHANSVCMLDGCQDTKKHFSLLLLFFLSLFDEKIRSKNRRWKYVNMAFNRAKMNC